MRSKLESLLPPGSPGRRAAALILILLALRLLLSAVMPLIADEAYAVVVSRQPSLSYFDHPLLGFGFARAAAWAFGSEATFVVRLPHVLLGSASAWLLFLVTRRAFGARAGLWAVAWYSVAPFFLVSAGHFVVPDGPLNFFMLLTLWLVLPDLLSEGPPRTGRWLVAGLALGAALLSKYTAALFGLGAFIVLAALPRGRRLLGSPGPWLAGVIAALCTAPILIWNMQHGWASLGFQSGRAFDVAAHPGTFLAVQLGQAGFLLPWIWVLALWTIVSGLFRPATSAERIFAILACVPVALFDAVSVFSSEPLPHWAMPGFLFAFPLVGRWCAAATARHPAAFRRLFAGSAAAVLLLALVVVLETNLAVVSRARGQSETRSFDWTFRSWSALADDFAARGILADGNAYLVPTSWLIGGKAGHALGPGLPVAPPVADPRHFAFMDDPRLAGRMKGYAVLAVWPGEDMAGRAELKRLVTPAYRPVGEPWTVVQRFGGLPAFDFVVQPVERRWRLTRPAR